MSGEVTGAGFADACDEAGRRIAWELGPSPCLRSGPLEAALGRRLWLKCELFQPTGSFKPRGVLNWLASASDAELAKPLVAVSAGNHGMALAWAGAARGLAVQVVMPVGSSPVKIQSCRGFGAEVVLPGDIDDAWAYARRRATAGATLVPPYDEPRIMAGQASVGLELAEQVPDVDTVLCPVGGGGLISGLAAALKRRCPRARVIGVEPTGAPTLARAMEAGEPVALECIDTIAASLGANRAGTHCLALARETVDDVVLVDDDAIVSATRLLLTAGKLYAEPGAALGVAALLAGAVRPRPEAEVAAVITGGNLDAELARQILR